jgi:hypothetical protein
MSRFFEDDGQTIESPGMVRWYSKPCHYFLKRIGNMWDGVTKPNTFVLGLENRMGDGAYAFNTSIEFDNDEAPDLMDRIASFNGLPTYTGLLKTTDKVNALVKELERMDRREDRHVLEALRGILEDD